MKNLLFSMLISFLFLGCGATQYYEENKQKAKDLAIDKSIDLGADKIKEKAK